MSSKKRDDEDDLTIRGAVAFSRACGSMKPAFESMKLWLLAAPLEPRLAVPESVHPVADVALTGPVLHRALAVIPLVSPLAIVLVVAYTGNARSYSAPRLALAGVRVSGDQKYKKRCVTLKNE